MAYVKAGSPPQRFLPDNGAVNRGAVYFGSVSIRYTRHAVVCGLLADLAGIIAAIAIGYFFFG